MRFLNCPGGGIMRKVIWELLDLKQQTWGKGLKQKWPEILILVIMTPALMWLLKLAWEQNSRMIALETRLTAFVNAMPELRRGIASAAINQPFRSALIVFRPRAVGEVWEGKIEVLDAEQGDITTYVAKLDETTKQMLEVNLIGSVKRIDSNALSFSEMLEQEKVAGVGGGEAPPSAIFWRCGRNRHHAVRLCIPSPAPRLQGSPSKQEQRTSFSLPAPSTLFLIQFG